MLTHGVHVLYHLQLSTPNLSAITKQRDKLTGNTKSQKKKQKNAQELFLKVIIFASSGDTPNLFNKTVQARIEQLAKLLRSENKAEVSFEEGEEYTTYEI